MASARYAVRLDDSMADAHAILGTVLGSGEFDWTAAEREFERAMALSVPAGGVPHDYAWCHAMWFLLPLRRVEAALSRMRRAVEADPLDPFYNALVGCLLFMGRQLDAAEEQLRHAIDLDPGFFFPHWLLSSVCAALDRPDDAVAAAERANELSRGQAMTVALVGRFYGTTGRVAEARRLIDELLARRRVSYVPASALAYIYRGLGEFGESAKWLALGIEERDPILVTSLPTTPTLDPLRSRESYDAVLRRMNLDPHSS
jgi:tetratricopeptide (TPR) repeat protein